MPRLLFLMAGLVPAIRVFGPAKPWSEQNADVRRKVGHGRVVFAAVIES
jgi:hypothetical protein